MKRRKSSILFLWMFLFPLLLSAGDALLIKARKLHTVSQGVLTNGMILIENGKIIRVEKNIQAPGDASVIEVDTVIPGLIDIHTHTGVLSAPIIPENQDGNEEAGPIAPQLRALDAFNFDDPAIKLGREGGVTTIVSRPGSGLVIGGTSVAVKLKNASPGEMILKEDCDLKMAVGGSSLMSDFPLVRKAFLEARDYQSQWDRYEKDKKARKSGRTPSRDAGKDVLVRVLKREIPIHVHCATASEMAAIIRLADEFGIRLTLAHCYWAHTLIKEIPVRKDIHFNIGPRVFFTDNEETKLFKNTPAILAAAGFKASIHTDSPAGSQQNIRQLASLCYRYGMSEDDALKSITLTAAEAAGLDDRIGSIEPGKDADLVCLDGDPFEFTTSVEKVFIDGKLEYQSPAGTPHFQTVVPEASTELKIPDSLPSSGTWAIKGGTVYTMAGTPLKDAVILVKDGKIQSVGRDVSLPPGCMTIDAGDFTILPGLVQARSHVGLSTMWRKAPVADAEGPPVAPALDVLDAVDPQAPPMAFCNQLGITSVLITPGNKNVIGGWGAVLKTTCTLVDKMTVKDKAVLMVGLGANAKRPASLPATRMGIAALLRGTLAKAQDYLARKEAGRGTEFARDMEMEALIPVLKGDAPVMIHCERRDDIATALRIVDEFHLRAILSGASEILTAADEIRKRGIPVVLESLLRGADSLEEPSVEKEGFAPDLPARLAAAGVKVAFRPKDGVWFSPAAAREGGDMLEIAAFAFRNGMSEEAALRACTIDAAEIVGLKDRIGSIEPGKDADIVVLRGHPFKTRSIPEAVFIDGKLVFKLKPGDRL